MLIATATFEWIKIIPGTQKNLKILMIWWELSLLFGSDPPYGSRASGICTKQNLYCYDLPLTRRSWNASDQSGCRLPTRSYFWKINKINVLYYSITDLEKSRYINTTRHNTIYLSVLQVAVWRSEENGIMGVYSDRNAFPG